MIDSTDGFDSNYKNLNYYANDGLDEYQIESDNPNGRNFGFKNELNSVQNIKLKTTKKNKIDPFQTWEMQADSNIWDNPLKIEDSQIEGPISSFLNKNAIRKSTNPIINGTTDLLNIPDTSTIKFRKIISSERIDNSKGKNSDQILRLEKEKSKTVSLILKAQSVEAKNKKISKMNIYQGKEKALGNEKIIISEVGNDQSVELINLSASHSFSCAQRVEDSKIKRLRGNPTKKRWQIYLLVNQMETSQNPNSGIAKRI